MSDTDTDRRANYIAGLRHLADILEERPELKLPFEGTACPISIYTHEKADTVAWARAVGQAKKMYDDDRNFGFELHSQLGGIEIRVYGKREHVCERVVTGTREVTKTVPDPEALAAVPTVTVTETVEDVEWICRPLLADDTQAVSA